MNANQIAHEIASGRISAREAVTGCIEQIQSTHAKLNAVVVSRFDEAVKEADLVDQARARGDAAGPLSGVPITIKESFDLTATPTTAGLTHRASHRAVTDAWVVARLRQAGAIVLGKTNVSQLLLHDSCSNPLYGQTNNPWKLDRSPGASSGGEAAILAVGGSALGIGSDIGGSVRLPADACGIHSFKPTSGRFPLEGHISLLPGQEPLMCQPGPLARSVADLALAMRVLSGARNSESVELRGLRIGFYTDNGVLKPSPAIRRAVTAAARALEARGLIVEEWHPPNLNLMWRIYCALLFSEGLPVLRRVSHESKLSPNIRRILTFGNLPKIAFSIGSQIATIAGQRQIAEGAAYYGSMTVEEYVQTLKQKAELCRTFVTSMNHAGIDAILCPVFAVPAMRHHVNTLINDGLSYTAIYNFLGMPAGVVAATRVRSDEESDRKPGMNLVEWAAKNVETGSAGLPVGVQVVARHWHEDVALGIMSALEEHFRAQSDYPAHPSEINV
jgi:Asp-tRNA(Asn)/Glu-tRNA(Gln) amidotransferase A subunit family amidase